MSSQAPHPKLLIPGPIEFDDAVLQSMSHYAESHTAPPFIKTFGETLTMVRQLFQSTNPAAQPFVVGGSGSLGWEMVAANLIEKGDNALVLITGYFGDSYSACLQTHGANVTPIKAPVGQAPSLAEIEQALKEKPYKLIALTHTDTSTGVLNNAQAITQLVRRVSPQTLVTVDGVCSVACEDIAFDAMDIDVVLTGSQKAIGCPPGLSISMWSPRALDSVHARKSPPNSYYASVLNWQPTLQNYENFKPSYFATPPTQLVHALHTSLSQILSRGLADRFAIHRATSDRVKAAIADLGLKQVASDPATQAHGMTAMWLPEGLTGPDVLPGLLKRGVIFAAGLHKEVAAKYIRFGHMGVSITDPARNDIDHALASLKEVLAEAKQAKGL